MPAVLVQTRGQGFAEAEPLRFHDLDALAGKGTSTQLGVRVGETHHQLGFRVVLELN